MGSHSRIVRAVVVVAATLLLGGLARPAYAGNWNVALIADRYSAPVGETVNLYAWNFWCQEPCPDAEVHSPYYLLVYEQGTGQLVGSCTDDWDCEVPVTQSQTGDHVYIAYVARYSTTAPPPDIVSASNPITVGWYREASPCSEEHPGSQAYVPVYVQSQSVSHVGAATPPGDGAMVCLGAEGSGTLYELELYASTRDQSGPGVVTGPCLMWDGGHYECTYYGVWTADPNGNPGVIVTNPVDPLWGGYCDKGAWGWYCVGEGVTTAGPGGTPYPVFCAWGPNVIPSGGCAAIVVRTGPTPGSAPGAWVWTQSCWRDVGSTTWNCEDAPDHTGASAGHQSPSGQVCVDSTCQAGGASTEGTTAYAADIEQPVGPADVHLDGAVDPTVTTSPTNPAAVRVDTGLSAHETVPQANLDGDQRFCATTNSGAVPCPAP